MLLSCSSYEVYKEILKKKDFLRMILLLILAKIKLNWHI